MKYVIAGSSAAGVNCARQLRRLDPAGEIIMVSKDRAVYSRCILHHYLSGARDIEKLSFVEKDFEDRYQIQFIKKRACTKLLPAEKKIYLEDGKSIAYDKLLLATGSDTFIPPVPGLKGAKNAWGFRCIDDVKTIQTMAETAKNIVILGGGLVGVDALSGLLHANPANVTLVEQAPHLLYKQLDSRAAAPYQEAFMKKGATFYFGTLLQFARQNDEGFIQEILLSDGTVLPCDLLIITTGVTPNTAFLEGSGLLLERGGLVIDQHCNTNLKDIYGAGDITGKSPIWPAAVKQGITAAHSMAGYQDVLVDFFASKATMNFEGIPTMSLGVQEAPDGSYTTITEDKGHIYKKIIHKNGKIFGAILQGDLDYSGILTQLIAHKIDVAKIEKPLFEVDYADFFHIDEKFQYYYEGAVS